MTACRRFSRKGKEERKVEKPTRIVTQGVQFDRHGVRSARLLGPPEPDVHAATHELVAGPVAGETGLVGEEGQGFEPAGGDEAVEVPAPAVAAKGLEGAAAEDAVADVGAREDGAECDCGVEEAGPGHEVGVFGFWYREGAWRTGWSAHVGGGQQSKNL